MTLPPEIPVAIQRRAVQLPGMDDDDWAWGQADAREALASLTGTIVAVFDVDVYVVPHGQDAAVHTGRRASYFYRTGEQALQFAERSRHDADRFIADSSRGELFVLEFSGQDEAEPAYGEVKTG